jgi:cyclic dehypoxanthinyl futalosine synthase
MTAAQDVTIDEIGPDGPAAPKHGKRHPAANCPPRLSEAEALEIHLDAPLHDLGRRAFEITERLHPRPWRTYVVDRNINYANWCTAKCIFCNFKADPPEMNSGRRDLSDGYTLRFDQIGRKIEELLAIGGTQILMQGGLVPSDGREGLPFEWYLDLMRYIRRNYPGIHIHAFSPPEIFAFHQIFGMPLRDILLRLHEAGLDSIPGGGGEILSDRVRRKIAPGKTLTAEWLEVVRQAHAVGMSTSCTMMFGHIETIEERIEHLRLLREVQDESLARGNGGGFGAFICWPFQPENTPLGRVRALPPDAQTTPDGRPIPDGKHLLLAGAAEYLRVLALSRIYLDNIPHIQSSWVTMGPKIGQLALYFGADDMGSVMMEENVVSAAGTTYRLNEAEIRRLITDAGWQPRKRDYYYRSLE